MPITDRLGTSDSELGNLTFGAGTNYSGNVFDKSVNHTLTLSQTVARLLTSNQNVSQTLTLTSIAGQSYNESGSNTLTLSQDAVAVLIGNTQVFQSLTLTQSAVATRVISKSVNQSLTLSHTVTSTQQFNRDASSTLTLTDLALRVLIGEAEDSLTLTQDVVAGKSRAEGDVQSLTLVQTVSRLMTYNRVVSQGLPITHSATRTISRVLSPTNTLVLSQSASGIATKLASNTLVFTQLAEVFVVKKAKNTLELTQFASVNGTYNRHLFANLIPFQTVHVNTTLRRTLSQSLTLTQSAVGVVVRAARSTLVLSQEVVVDKVTPAFSQLALVQTVGMNATRNLGRLHVLTLTQNVKVTHSRQVSAHSYLGFNQFARGTRVLHESVVQTLPLSQDLVRDRYVESVTSDLVLDQDATAQKIATRSTESNLVLAHSVQVSKTIVRSVAHTLTFRSSFQKYVGLPNHQYIDVPAIQVVKVKSITILQSDNAVIVLPAPEFNDKEAGMGRVNIKRAMDGTRRVYKRATVASKLVYDFVLDRLKAIELRTFILGNNSKVITVTNWKGEIWATVLTSNPFSFTEEAYWASTWGNKSLVTLEFEGVRLN